MRAAFCLLLLVGFVLADDFKLEEGYTPLFNGKDLTGWKARKGNIDLADKTESPGKRWTIKDGMLVIDGKGKGENYIVSQKEFAKDFTLRFEVRPGPMCNNDVFIRGRKFDITLKLKGIKENEWNKVEIEAKGKEITFKFNDTEQKAAKNKDFAEDKSPLMLRAEFGSIDWRRLRYKE